MYSKEITLTVKWGDDIILDCECTVASVDYNKYSTLSTDVIESIDRVLHNGVDIQDLIAMENINVLFELCYEQYHKG